MPYKIRAKLIIAFLAIIFPFLLITGLIALYNQNEMRKSQQMLAVVTKEMQIVGQIQLLTNTALMPANDYIITGDKKYIDEFKNIEAALEKEINEAAALEILMPEEKEIIRGFKDAWQNIKDISNKIFAIQNPIGNKDAAKLMEEMDYKWAYPSIKRLMRWHEIDEIEYRAAIERMQMAWMQSWVIMFIGAAILMAISVFFVFYYTKLFVKPINLIHNGADKIAAGDFKTRLDIKTGDEIEQLSNAMNEMAAQLDNFYETLEQRIEERTAELKESEERFRVIAETASDAIVCIKSPDIVYIWNKKAEEMFGYSEDEAMGRSLHDLIIPKAYIEKHKEGLKRFFEAGQGPIVGKTTELSALHKDGAEFPIELSISAMNMHGEWHATGITRDITERKETEKKLAEQMDFLKRFHKAAVQREFRIKELKDRVKELEEELKRIKI